MLTVFFKIKVRDGELFRRQKWQGWHGRLFVPQNPVLCAACSDPSCLFRASHPSRRPEASTRGDCDPCPHHIPASGLCVRKQRRPWPQQPALLVFCSPVPGARKQSILLRHICRLLRWANMVHPRIRACHVICMTVISSPSLSPVFSRSRLLRQ